MLSFPSPRRIWLARSPTDMRRGIDTLVSMADVTVHQIVIGKFADATPCNRTLEIKARAGCRPSGSVIDGAVAAMGDLLARINPADYLAAVTPTLIDWRRLRRANLPTPELTGLTPMAWAARHG